MSTSVADLKEASKKKRCDYIVCGSLSGAKPFTLKLVVFDRKNKKILYKRKGTLNRMTEIFNLTDKLTLELLGDLTGEEIKRGALRFVNSGDPGLYSVAINGRKMDDGLQKLPLIQGRYLVKVESKTGTKKKTVYSDWIRVREGEESQVEFSLPFRKLSKFVPFGIIDENCKTYDDRAQGGSSTISVEPSEDSVAISGKVSDEYEYCYAGFVYLPESEEMLNLKRANGIRFKVKGLPGNYDIRLETSNVKSYSFYHKTFNVSNEWTVIDVKFKDMRLYDFGAKVPLLPEFYKTISFQTIDKMNASIDYTIKDVELF